MPLMNLLQNIDSAPAAAAPYNSTKHRKLPQSDDDSDGEIEVR